MKIKHSNLILFILIYFSLALSTTNNNFGIPLSREFSLENSILFPTEYLHHENINNSKSHSTSLPINCLKTSKIIQNTFCEKESLLIFNDSNSQIKLHPIIAFQKNYLKKSSKKQRQAIDAGLILTGYQSNLFFYLDARLFVEQSNIPSESFDQEFVEQQNGNSNDSKFSFTSYSRYRTNLNLKTDWGNIGFRRDALHWGPGIFLNLVFNQTSTPFNHFYYSTQIGPFKITSLYGRLSIDGQGQFRATEDTRSLYAHRYEYQVTNNLILGVSEQIIFYNTEEPSAIIPIVPLFMEKGQGLEQKNNGNISFDFLYKKKNLGSIYSEFLIDDLSEPASLFNDFWKNRWAIMAGAHLIKDFNLIKTGTVFEHSRIEPWVYTHYFSNTAQPENHGVLLGNTNGPNSQNFHWKNYIRTKYYYFGVTQEWGEKGLDFGSSTLDYLPNDALNRKDFLASSTHSYYEISLSLGINFFYSQIRLKSSLLHQKSIQLRLQSSF